MNDLISRKNMLSDIEENIKKGESEHEDLAVMMLEVIKKYIEEFPVADVQPMNMWISVDDKLPEWDKTVLVWYASDTLFGVSEGYGLSWYHGSWRVNDLNGENIRIFYWQYLPEKPKDGDKQ